MASLQSLSLQINDSHAILKLNRPEVHNAVGKIMMDEFELVLDQLDTTQDVRVLTITGAGDKTFCAGGDLKYFATLETRDACLRMSHRMQSILGRFTANKRFVIGAVNGQALGGGCELLSACHYCIAAAHATFAMRQAPNGIITGWGGGRRLLARLGTAEALQLMLTGKRIDAIEAGRIGLVQKVVAAPDLLSTATELAQGVVANSSEATSAFIELSQLYAEGVGARLIEREAELFADLWTTDTFRQFLQNFSNTK